MISVITGSDGYSEVTIKQLIASTTSNNILYTYVASYILCNYIIITYSLP